jgi:hypothetical protein
MSIANETVQVEDNTSVETVEDLGNLTLDDLLAMSEDDVEEFKQENHTGMKPLHHWMQHMPEDVRKHLANIRGDYTRKTQEIATIRKSLEAKEREIYNKNEHIMKGSLAQKLENIDTSQEYDLFDPEGMKAEIQRQAQLMLKEMLQPAQEELQLQQRKLQLEDFKRDNPELADPEYRKPVLELLASRPELKLEDAFYIVKAKVGSQKVNDERSKFAEQKSARRDTALKSSVGSRTNVAATPKFKNAIEAYQWHKSNGVK